MTATYVPAYEPESYTSHAATAHPVEYEFRDETPIYVAPAPPARDEESLDESAERHEDERRCSRTVSLTWLRRRSHTVTRHHGPTKSKRRSMSRCCAYGEPDVAQPDTVAHCDPAPRPDAEQAPMYVEDASLQMLASVDDQSDDTVAGSASVPIDEPAAHIEQQDAVDEDMPVAIAYQMTDDVEPIVDMDDVEPIDDEASDVVATPVIVESQSCANRTSRGAGPRSR